jgi:3' terminal RNA ribose 2'-O-methyltransferase Hen1
MLLTITNELAPAMDLGYLLHKNPARAQSFDLPFGEAHVFYPEASEGRCTAALLVEVDPVGLVRGRGRTSGEYVSDRPYAALSFLSVAISRVFGSALSGKSRERPEAAAAKLPLRARLAVVPCREGEAFLRRLFEPLGYSVSSEPHPLDEALPGWGDGPYFTVSSACPSASTGPQGTGEKPQSSTATPPSPNPVGSTAPST